MPTENTRTATKARIKRATTAAQRAMDKLDAAARADLHQLYRSARVDIEQQILTAGDARGVVGLDRLQSLRQQIDIRLQQLAIERNEQLAGRLKEGADLGTKPYTDVVISGQLSQISDDAVRFVREFTSKKGLQLSGRLWRLDAAAKDAVAGAVERAVINGYSASQAAQDFLRRGAAVPADIQARMGEAMAQSVAKKAGRALMVDEGNAYENAKRVFRTEINRAHGSAYQEAGFKVPGVVGTRFLLSPAHPKPDICDMHAKANLYGLGPGVYPKGKSPWPAHPNTLSYEVVVFEDEVTDADREGKTDRVSWLKDQSVTTQTNVLGARAKQAAFERGILKENEIRTPWRVLKKRYEKRGIDIEGLGA